MVETALFQRAIGYRHPAVKFFFDAESGHVQREEYTEIYPPDAKACEFWLKNRSPKRWKDSKNLELTGKGGGPIEHSFEEFIGGSMKEDEE